MASDGKWYPPESHPDYLPPRSEPPATQRMPVPVAETPDAPATFARRPAAWHERRRVRVAGGVLGTIVVLGIIGSLTEEDDEPSTRVRSNLVDTTVSSIPEVTTTIETTTTSTSTTSTTTTVVSTTVATTAVPSTSARPVTTTASGNCSAAYPTVCIPPPPPDLNCDDIPYRRFQVLPPDPHRLDGNDNGLGCES